MRCAVAFTRKSTNLNVFKNIPPGPTRLQTESKNSRLAHVEHTFSKNCTFQRASRLHQMHILKIECRLVHTKCQLFLKYDVSSTPNTYFWERIRHVAETRMLISGNTMGNAVCKLASRLRRTPHSQKTALSTERLVYLHQIHIRKIQYRRACGKCYLF